MTFLSRSLLAILLASGVSLAAAAEIRRVPGEPVIVDKSEPVATFRADEAIGARMTLAALDLSRIAAVQKRNRESGVPMQIGVGRDGDEALVRLPALRWTKIDGGSVARFEVKSPDALALRVGLKFASLPAGLEVRVAGSLAPALVQFTSAPSVSWQHKTGGSFWTPMTDGDVQVVELFAPTGVDTRNVGLRVEGVSHMLTNTIERFSLAKAIGDSGECNVDTICRIGTLGQDFVDTKNSVARMVFQVGSSSYTCTGTLLADTVSSSQIPYFWTADHCIGNQSEASTLTTFWGFEATSCGGSVAAANTQVGGGATYLYSDHDDPDSGIFGTDAALLRLNGTPPPGAYFSGWNANTLANGTDVLAVHHPQGDLKKSSLGRKMSQDAYSHIVGWLSGTTEPGSSGSGLFTATGSGGAYELRGGLYGGLATCDSSGDLSDSGNRDYYSRLDLVYDEVDQWLAPTSTAPGPTRDYTGAWYVPSEPGWGFTAFQYDNEQQVLFILFFIYDEQGRAKWYEMGGGWTDNDVREGDVLQSTANQGWGTTYSGRVFSDAGNARLQFTSATSATLQLTVNGVTRNVTVQKL